MSKTIEGIPEFITYDQYLALFAACGVEPKQVIELRMATDGIHILVIALDEQGKRRIDMKGGGYYKHRIFIPVQRASDDARTTRVTDVNPLNREHS